MLSRLQNIQQLRFVDFLCQLLLRMSRCLNLRCYATKFLPDRFLEFRTVIILTRSHHKRSFQRINRLAYCIASNIIINTIITLIINIITSSIVANIAITNNRLVDIYILR